MRHAGDDALRELDDVVAALRAMPQLREHRTGAFSRGGRAFSHFHEDGERLFVDVRLVGDGGFERVELTTKAQRRRFLAEVRRVLREPAPNGKSLSQR